LTSDAAKRRDQKQIKRVLMTSRPDVDMVRVRLHLVTAS
jgi:hypothetical protein